MQSCPDQVVAHLIQEHLDEEKVREFLKKQGVGDESPEGLVGFLTSPRVRERLEKQWRYETDPRWRDRTVSEALRETTLHALSSLSGDAQLYLYRSDREGLPNASPEEAEEIEKRTGLLCRFFNTEL